LRPWRTPLRIRSKRALWPPSWRRRQAERTLSISARREYVGCIGPLQVTSRLEKQSGPLNGAAASPFEIGSSEGSPCITGIGRGPTHRLRGDRGPRDLVIVLSQLLRVVRLRSERRDWNSGSPSRTTAQDRARRH